MNKVIGSAKHAVGALAIAALLASCATAAQRQYQAMASNNRNAAQAYQACVSAVYNSPEASPLRRNLPFGVNNATLQQLANQNYATDAEIGAVIENYPKLQSCRQTFLSQLAQTTPTLVPIFVAAETRIDNDVITLIQKRVSWGQFLQEWKEIAAQESAQLVAEGQRLVAGLEQSHEAELARRQAAFDALARSAQTQQIIANMNRPVNCTTMDIRTGFSTTTCQ